MRHRNEREMLEAIVAEAQADDRIRAVILNGSRANPTSRQDDLQDYDVLYLVHDVEPFASDRTWADRFGKRIMMQMPEAMRDPLGDGRFTYLMLFEDGNRIDATFYPVERYSGSPLETSDAIVLFDKDGLLEASAPSDRDYRVPEPTNFEFQSCCNDFLWCSQNIAKGIVREEVPYAIMMLERVLRPELHGMIDWCLSGRSPAPITTGKFGKRYPELMRPDEYKLYEQTVFDADRPSLWNRLYSTIDLFLAMADEVGMQYGFEVPHDEADAMKGYLASLEQSPFEGC